MVSGKHGFCYSVCIYGWWHIFALLACMDACSDFAGLLSGLGQVITLRVAWQLQAPSNNPNPRVSRMVPIDCYPLPRTQHASLLFA